VPQVALNRAAAQCPLWVISGHFPMSDTVSALTPKADIRERSWIVRFGPKADIDLLLDDHVRQGQPIC
jgi:hypothetical protein